MIWELDVRIDQDTLPEYNELIDELKKIPDVVIALRYGQVPFQVSIAIYDLEEKYKKYAIITYYYEKGVVQLEIHDLEIPGIIEEREVSAKDNKKAISLLAGFTRYAMAKMTKDIKYIKETVVSQDDITQIKPIYVRTYTLSEDEVRDMIESLNLTENCKIIREYSFYIKYVYPRVVREVRGYIFCCPNQCYLYITRESQEGDFVGNKRFVIDLKGKKPTFATLEEILKTRTDLLMDIERYIRETLEKMEGS